MAAESQNSGAEPSPADGGQACNSMAGLKLQLVRVEMD